MFIRYSSNDVIFVFIGKSIRSGCYKYFSPLFESYLSFVSSNFIMRESLFDLEADGRFFIVELCWLGLLPDCPGLVQPISITD